MCVSLKQKRKGYLKNKQKLASISLSDQTMKLFAQISRPLIYTLLWHFLNSDDNQKSKKEPVKSNQFLKEYDQELNSDNINVYKYKTDFE
jgi:hypothetical protein